MSSQISGNAIRTNVYGVRVDRATAALPQTTTGTLFTVTGGRVLLTTLVGEVTTSIQAQANSVQLITVSAVGAVSTNFSAALDVNGLAAGNLLTSGGAGAALVAGSSVVQNNEVIVQPGTIRLSAAASNTGSVRWTVTYIPLDSGATITAA